MSQNNVIDILKQREATHGAFAANAEVSQKLKLALWQGANYKALSLAQREALDLICSKLARIVSGNPNLVDHWVDTSGYATLAAETIPDRLPEGISPKQHVA